MFRWERQSLMAADEVEAVADNLIEAAVAVIEAHDLAVDVRGTDLLEAPLLQLHHRGVANHLLEHLVQGLVLVHDLFECFLIFHTISIKEFGGKDHHNLSPHTTSNVN